MIEIDPRKFKQAPPPLKHQLVGVRALVTRAAFYLGDKPRTMKSRQVVDAACTLLGNGLIRAVLVIAPVAGRGVWGNAKLGQVKRWSWKRSEVYEYHAKVRKLWGDENPELLWMVTNYDFVRSDARVQEIKDIIAPYDRKVLLVLDESKAVSNHNSLQSKAVAKIREACDRVVMLNGTPGGPDKQWSQFNILDHVFDRRHKSFTTFKWRYAKYGPGEMKIVRSRNGNKGGMKMVHHQVGWKNLDKLSRITAPYCLMRERKDCEGLRDVKVVSSFREVRLAKETWRMYQELKREALLELEGGEIYVSPNIASRLLRLAQICSGHLGGFQDGEKVRDFSSEKIDWLVKELSEECLAQNVLVWCRWVREREQVAKRLAEGGMIVYEVHGGQNKNERREAEMIFAEDAERERVGRYAMIAQPQAGGMALDFSAASDVYRMSSDYNWETFAQSNDRPLGPGQKAEFVSSTDVIATGPDGQRTIEHVILESREAKRAIERMTCAEWRTELTEE